MEYNEDLEFISKKTKLKTIEYIFYLLPETTTEEIKKILHYELMYMISQLNNNCYVDKSFLAYILWLLTKTFNGIRNYDNKGLVQFSPFCDTTILTYFFTCYIIANKFLLDVCMNPKSVADTLEFNHQNLLNNELSILALLNYYIIPSDEELIEFRKIIN
jgi:hypothetical protein